MNPWNDLVPKSNGPLPLDFDDLATNASQGNITNTRILAKTRSIVTSKPSSIVMNKRIGLVDSSASTTKLRVLFD